MSESERPFVDPGHILPDEDWAKVVARAKEVRAEVAASAEGGASGVGGIVLDMTALGRASKKYFPVSGIPTQLLVLHSAECPLAGGYAKSLSEWACGTVYPAPPVASWQRFVDPIHRVRLVPDELGAWAASEANTRSISWEQAGYARFTRDQWLTADGQVQLEMLALDMAEVAVRDGIPARWLTDWEVRQVLDHDDQSIKGFCNHRQIDPETRTDPGDGYPYDLLMERIIFYMGGGEAVSPDTTPTGKDEQMLYLAAPGDNRIWLSNGVQKWHVPDPAHLVHIKTLGGWGAISLYGGGDAQVLEAPALGVDMGAFPVADVSVDLKEADVEFIAASLKASLSADVAAELARRLAE